jgi:methionyl-tRNA synthetase
MKNQKFYITTPLYYSNDFPHIGSAYTTIAADVLARWYRAKGYRVYFQTGVDEHGAKMAKAAEMAGFKNPKRFCDRQARFWNKVWQDLNISYDYFIRTTAPFHEKFVQKFLEKIWQKGEIYKGKYEGLYCLGCEEFKQPSDLILGKCPLHNSKPEKVKEINYFFKLSRYQDKLIKLIESDKIKIEPKERKNEILGFLKKEKLEDISISREKIKWGIPVPWDRKQTIYCWIDALLNYLSGGEKFWPSELHLIGKDILKFHAIIWPALLLAGGYDLPKKIYAHGFFTLGGKKISKTMGNIIYAEDLVKKHGADSVRYILLREIPFGQDGDFSEGAIKRRYNTDLANNLGNLIQRVSVMVDKYFDGDLMKLEVKTKKIEEFEIIETWQKIDQFLSKLQFHEALTVIWQLIDCANKYIENQKPWEQGETKKNKEKQKRVLGNLVEVIREISEMLLPFMPETASKIQNQFKGPKIKVEKPLFPRYK